MKDNRHARGKTPIYIKIKQSNTKSSVYFVPIGSENIQRENVNTSTYLRDCTGIIYKAKLSVMVICSHTARRQLDCGLGKFATLYWLVLVNFTLTVIT